MFNDEQSVMQKLGISSWRNLSKDKFMNFVSMMPEMSDEVRIKIIEQLPQFAKLCTEGLDTAKEAFTKVLDKNDKTTTALVNEIGLIRDSIAKELDKDDLSSEDRRFIIEQLMEIAKMYNNMDERNKKFFDTTFGKLLMGIGALVGAVIVFVGGKYLLSSSDNSES